jgi:hypothetical protein
MSAETITSVADPKVIWAVAQEQDLFAGFARLEEGRSALDCAASYAALANWLYNDRKDVPALVAVSRAGIQFCLLEAKRQSAENVAVAEKLRSSAKAMAYNLGANTWPGWDEKDRAPSAADLAAGRDAAKLNLRLGVELKRGPEPMGNAHWLVGAHELAASEFVAAAEAFDRSAVEFERAEKADFSGMAKGYAALARHLGGEKPASEYQAAIKVLEDLKTEDAKFFVEQIRTAEKVFRQAGREK